MLILAKEITIMLSFANAASLSLSQSCMQIIALVIYDGGLNRCSAQLGIESQNEWSRHGLGLGSQRITEDP